MAEPVRDRVTVTPAGDALDPLPEGVVLRDVTTHFDERGWVVEVFDPRWGWHPEPMVFSYVFSIRPGFVKGWGLHAEHEDRYFILMGTMEVVLYDERPGSPTEGLVAKVVLSEHRRRLMNIPAGIWHADHNIGEKEVVIINFPTIQYDHSNPDKYRLPLDTDRIPYRFESPRGW